MTTLFRSIVALSLVLLVANGVEARKADPAALARGLAAKLFAQKNKPAPRTHATDFGTEALGCITLTSSELYDFGYRGHAFLCEEGSTGEVLGAVLGRAGGVRCYIYGEYVGEGCYDFDICEVAESACVE